MGSASSIRSDQSYDKIVNVFQAIQQNKFKAAKKIMSSGVEINCINYIGATPLIETCRSRHLPATEIGRNEFVQFLIELGCDVKRNDIHGWTAVLYAEENGHETIVEMLETCEIKKKILPRDQFPHELETIFEEE
ncbi:Hypothetical predicted protein [Mytilus galloprovincialis]|uniref:Uncharacterized protein n=1 Tax=Mytilus galloprovincialis TaxID=29158 RepID=A0A8B6EW05_MYTGA|nr:Hypothetical predicted protein [Mytilus galloprovincialis]